MATVKAFIRVSTKKTEFANIRFRLSDGRGKQLFYKSDIKVRPEQWEPKKEMIKPKIVINSQERDHFNNEVAEMKKRILRLYNQEPDKSNLSTEWLDIAIDRDLNPGNYKAVEVGFFDFYQKYIDDSLLSEGRKKHLGTTLNKLKAFDPNTTFEAVDCQYLTDFQKYLLTDCDLSKNTATSEMRRLRAFMNYAVKHGWAKNYPFDNFSIDAETYGDPVFITIEERDKLFGAYIPNASLSRVRDMFVFQCLIGCRVGDLIRLKKSNIVNGCIEYIAGKTKDHKPRIARVPLTEKAKAILSKYDLSNGDLLPYLTDQRYNVYIKDLFRYVGIKRIVTTVDPKTRKSVQKPICDIASSHMARRVFVGNLHRKGVKNEIIASMSGHTENSKAFSRYYSIGVEDQKSAINLIE